MPGSTGHDRDGALKPTEFPEGSWQELHADYKGPIGRDWYLHILIDQYSKFTVVHVVKSPSWEQLKSGLEDTLATYGIPKRITTDGGPRTPDTSLGSTVRGWEWSII